MAFIVLGVRVGTSAAAELLLCERVFPELAQTEATLSYMADLVSPDAHNPRLATSSARCRRHCCSPVASLPQRIVVVNRSAAQDDKPERLHDSFSAVDYSGSR